MQKFQNKTMGMLAGGMLGWQGAEKFSDDLAIITMFYSNMARPPQDVFKAVWDTLSTSYYVLLIVAAAGLVRWLTKNAPEMLSHIQEQPVQPVVNPAPLKE
jgi:hypothetical protein